MASGQELATAYLSLTVSAKGIQKDIARELGASEYAAEASGRRMGDRLASGIKAGAKVAGVAVAALLGTALTKGFGRLSAIENAQASLSGLGNSAEDVSAIMKNALAAVKGTAFGMDEAASTAATAVAAGIKPGKELEGVLRLVGDAATIGGSTMSEMGAIFGKVATSNKVQGDVIAQLNDRGIPIVQMLGKQLGVTSEEVTKMASEGKIGFETFRDAMEAGLGGAALKSGETTKGAFKNMMAALSRIGAGLLGGVFPYFKTVFGGITGLLDGLEAKLTPLAKAFGSELAGGIMAFGEAWKANDGDITSSGFPGMMERLANSLRGVKDLASGFWAGFTLPSDLVAEFGDELHPVLAFGVRVRDMMDGVRDNLAQFWAGLTMDEGTRAQFAGQLDGFVDFGASVRDMFDKFKLAVGELWQPLLDLALALSPLQLVFNAIAPVLPNIADLIGQLAGVAASLAAVVAGVLTSALEVLIPIIVDIVEWVAGFISGLTDSQEKLDVLTGFIIAGTAGFAAYKTAVFLATVQTKAHGLATKVAAGGQRLLNLAMKANPIGLIIAGIAALVAGLVWFFTQTETGKNIVAAAWAGIQNAAGAVVDWFQGTVVPIFTAVWEGIAGGAKWLYEKAIKPVWDGISSAVGAVVDWFQNVLVPTVESVFDAVGAVFTWLYETIVKPIFDLIWWAVSAWWTLTSGLFQVVVAVFRNYIAPVFTWFYEDIIKPVFERIGSLVSTWWDGVKNTFTTVVDFIRNTLSTAFTWFRDSVIMPVWGWISGFISDRVTTLRNNFNRVVTFVRDTLGVAFTWFRDSIIMPVWDWISSFISDRVATLRSNFNLVVDFLRNTLGVAFTWFRDSIITPVWNTIRDVISSVWNNGIKPIFDTISDAVQNKLPAAFEAAKNGITSAWDKIKDAAKLPVEFVVNKVINDGLIGTFNKIPGVDIKKIPLPPGFRKGGYTGDVGVDEVAGVVHGKEFVVNAAATAAIGKDNLAAMAHRATRGGAATHGEGNMGGFFEVNAANIRRHGAYFLNVPASMSDWGFGGAARMWDGAAGVRVGIGRGQMQGHASPRERGGGVLGYTVGNNIDMSPSWMRQLGAQQRQTVAAHEMGHALGLPHNSRSSIMQPNLANMASGPTAVDIRNLQALYPGGSGKAGSPVDNPFDGLIDKLMGQFKAAFPGGGMFIDAAGGLANSGIGQVIQWVTDIKDGLKNIASDVVGKISGFFGGGAATATVYDGGGWLERSGRPQLVQHNRSKPDAVLSSEQWGTMTRIAQNSDGATGGGVTIHGDVYGATPEQIVDEWDTKQRRAASLNNLRKVVVG